MLMHPVDKLDGGLSGIERRARIELALGQGARQAAIIPPGPVLDDAAALSVAKDMRLSRKSR
jgi:hypothetical protein